MLVESFPPSYRKDARILILGSMPGTVSLSANKYYAHSRNVFWPLMSEVLSSALPADYEARLEWLKKHRIALWDVLRNCERPGSLDSNIKVSTEVGNALPELVARLPELRVIAFNGRKAEQAFKRHYPELYASKAVSYRLLPSTSPANAAKSREAKTKEWAEALQSALV